MQSFIQYRRLRESVRQQLAQSVDSVRNSSTSLEYSSNPRTAPPPPESVLPSANQVVGDDKSGELKRNDVPSDSSFEPEAVLGTKDEDAHQSAPTGRTGGHINDIEASPDDFHIVEFEGEDDENNPRNWTFRQKAQTTLLVLGAGIVGGWASANDSTVIPQAMETFGVSEVVESLTTGLYLVAFGVGSLVSGPFSETVGRNPIYLATLVLFVIFVMAAALAPNIGAQLVFRFLAGIFGCTAVTTFAGSVADLWAPDQRALVFTLSSTINFCGIYLSPMVAAQIGQSPRVSWRWTEWIAVLMGSVFAVSIGVFSSETYAPTILSWKAAILRQETANTRYRSEQEIRLEPLWVRLLRSTYRPFNMLVREITVMLFTAYLTVLYVVCFTFLTGYTFIYGDIYHMSQGSVGLCFLGLDVGILFAGAMGLPLHRKYIRDLTVAKANGHQQLPPETRLWFAMLSAPCLPVGLFWMAWTANQDVSYWCSLVGSSLIGVAFLGIFVSSYLYLIDSFEHFAASALSVSTFVRYVASGVMIPVSIPMYKKLGVHWALTLLGCEKKQKGSYTLKDNEQQPVATRQVFQSTSQCHKKGFGQVRWKSEDEPGTNLMSLKEERYPKPTVTSDACKTKES